MRIYRASVKVNATGRDPEQAAVAVTQGIVQALSEEELAHELTRIINRDTLPAENSLPKTQFSSID